jgi:endonuclease YncB( thermonuclease family)
MAPTCEPKGGAMTKPFATSALGLVATLSLALFAEPVSAQDATVVDDDTIRLSGKVYHFWGIDALEAEQRCGSWEGGREATEHLKKFIAGKTVTCEPKAVDRFGQTFALCRADKVDLGEMMVRDGYAWAFVDYCTDYVDEEKAGYEANLGIHRYGCERAWEWRPRTPGGGKARR